MHSIVARPSTILVALLTLAAVISCTPSDEQVEPPRLADRVFSAADSSVDAIVYLTSEDRRRPGPGRLSQRFDRYRLQVRRLADGAIVATTPLGDTTDYSQDSTPTVIGITGNVFWIRYDSLIGYRLPTLEPTALAAYASSDSRVAALLRDSLAKLSNLPFWLKPGMARLFTDVQSGLLPVDSVPSGAARSLKDVGVLMRNDRSAWRVETPASVLVMSRESDSTWSVSRVAMDGAILWTTPTAFTFANSIVLLDAPTFVVLTDTQSNEGRSGARDRVMWVNVESGAAQMLEIASGVVTTVKPR